MGPGETHIRSGQYGASAWRSCSRRPHPVLSSRPEEVASLFNRFTLSLIQMSFNGFAGSCASTAEAQLVINALNKYASHGLNVFRWTSNPSWTSGTRPWSPTNLQYFLDHCNYNLIICRNHLYPPSAMTEAQWTQAEADIFNDVLSRWGNNPRVLVEIVNECNQTDSGSPGTTATIYHAHIQKIITDIRNAGYTNIIVQDNQAQPFVKYNDPLNKMYQGSHFYFNEYQSRPPLAYIKQYLNQAISKGITNLVMTEVGASTSEPSGADPYSDYVVGNTAYPPMHPVTDLKTWLKYANGEESDSPTVKIGCCIWLNHAVDNLDNYEANGLATWLPYFNAQMQALTLSSNPSGVKWTINDVGNQPAGGYDFPQGSSVRLGVPSQVSE